jgi:hypothetical protein
MFSREVVLDEVSDEVLVRKEDSVLGCVKKG